MYRRGSVTLAFVAGFFALSASAALADPSPPAPTPTDVSITTIAGPFLANLPVTDFPVYFAVSGTLGSAVKFSSDASNHVKVIKVVVAGVGPLSCATVGLVTTCDPFTLTSSPQQLDAHVAVDSGAPVGSKVSMNAHVEPTTLTEANPGNNSVNVAATVTGPMPTLAAVAGPNQPPAPRITPPPNVTTAPHVTSPSHATTAPIGTLSVPITSTPQVTPTPQASSGVGAVSLVQSPDPSDHFNAVAAKPSARTGSILVSVVGVLVLLSLAGLALGMQVVRRRRAQTD